jgi:enoyl-CoA hydratase/carnithine racemase
MTAVELATLEDNIACVTLNRPSRLNAIDGSLIDAMDGALDALESGEFRAAILTGAGRGFCAGADLSGTGEAWTKSAPQSPAFKINYDAQVRLADLYTRLYELPIPVIAAVNGVAVGGGLAFALHCDIRIASEQARFGSVRFSSRPGSPRWTWAPATCCRRSSEPGWRGS